MKTLRPNKLYVFGVTSLLVKGVILPFSRTTPTFSKIPPSLEIEDVPTFHRSIGKSKVLNNSCNQFVDNSYPQSILILEECLQKW